MPHPSKSKAAIPWLNLARDVVCMASHPRPCARLGNSVHNGQDGAQAALVIGPYGPYSSGAMPKTKTYGAEDARTRLPELLERAHRGERSVITKRGKPYAAVVPVDTTATGKPRLPLLSLEGSGIGLWGGNSRETIERMRDEWE